MKKLTINIAIVVFYLTAAFLCRGQVDTNELNKKKLLIVKFENVIKVKEPNFKGGRTGESGERPLELISSLYWKNEESLVDIYVEDFYSESDSIKYFKMNYGENSLNPARIYGVKITNLGDETWMIPIKTNYEHSRTQLVLRKGTVKLFIRSTSNALAIRFAEYLVKVIQENN